KWFYGLLERQFRRYLELASRTRGNTGEALLSLMERRLDNVVHRLGFATCRTTARQMVAHGHVLVNGRKCDIPSVLLRPGDVVKVKVAQRSQQLSRLQLQQWNEPIPGYLER